MASSSTSSQREIEIVELSNSKGEELWTPSQSSLQHVVTVDKLSASTQEKLGLLPHSSPECCVYRVPKRMRMSNEKYFTPQIVSIGPIHRQNEKLRANEHLKEKYLSEFLQHGNVSLNECFQLISNNEIRLRNCYVDVIELNSENFLQMVLVDAAFLLMILVYNSCESLLSDTDRVFKKSAIILDIKFDIVLLENQLPFFILEELFKNSELLGKIKSERPEHQFKDPMRELVSAFFLSWRMIRRPLKEPRTNGEHILDLLRSNLIPSNWLPERQMVQTINMPSIKELCQAGVNIQIGDPENMFDIRFHVRGGILEIPQLTIFDNTELVFRNLVAFELCHYPKEHIFSDYVDMIRLLAVSTVDTELLMQNGVIKNGLTNAERVSRLFQNIDTGNLVWSEFSYKDVIEGSNDYYKGCWHKWKATWKQKYFKAPWAICSVSAAILLLMLTIVQSVFTILQLVVHK